MAKSCPPAAECGFTLIEVIVVLGVIAIMMSLTYPAYVTISERAKGTRDLNNLHQIALGTQLYMNDNNGVFPGVYGIAVAHSRNLKTSASGSASNVLQSPFRQIVASSPARTSRNVAVSV